MMLESQNNSLTATCRLRSLPEVVKFLSKFQFKFLSNTSKLFALLFLTTLFDLVLLAYRLYYTDFDFSQMETSKGLMRYRGTPTYLFLVWNLFLAWIPYWIALSLEKIARFRVVVGIALVLWLLFFPNAPYIITDLLHLRPRSPVPFWYDVLLLFTFAWTGALLGFLSLLEVHQFLKKRLPRWWAAALVGVAIGLCGLGVFIGRFQRWNSWDALTDPFALTRDIGVILLHPIEHAKTLGLAVVLSTLLALGYLTLKTLVESAKNETA